MTKPGRHRKRRPPAGKVGGGQAVEGGRHQGGSGPPLAARRGRRPAMTTEQDKLIVKASATARLQEQTDTGQKQLATSNCLVAQPNAARVQMG